VPPAPAPLAQLPDVSGVPSACRSDAGETGATSAAGRRDAATAVARSAAAAGVRAVGAAVIATGFDVADATGPPPALS
jgi:hypothetical protein